MSYILEALKESQRNREEQRVPDLMTVHAEDEPATEKSGRGQWSWVLLVLVLIAAGAGWWFAGQRQPPVVTTDIAVVEPAVPQAMVDPEPSSPLEESEVVSAAAIDPAPVTVSDVPSDAADVPPVEEVPALAKMSEPTVSLPQPIEPAAVVVPAELAESTGKLLQEKAIEPQASPEPVMEQKPAVEQPSPVTQVDPQALAKAVGELPPAGQSVDTKEEQISPPLAKESEAMASSEEVAAETEEPRIPHYRELPFDVQQMVAGVKYSVHLYSPHPDRRLVKINGIVRREGSEVAPGMFLEQITPDGAIFTYREYRFRVPVR